MSTTFLFLSYVSHIVAFLDSLYPEIYIFDFFKHVWFLNLFLSFLIKFTPLNLLYQTRTPFAPFYSEWPASGIHITWAWSKAGSRGGGSQGKASTFGCPPSVCQSLLFAFSCSQRCTTTCTSCAPHQHRAAQLLQIWMLRKTSVKRLLDFMLMIRLENLILQIRTF